MVNSVVQTPFRLRIQFYWDLYDPVPQQWHFAAGVSTLGGGRDSQFSNHLAEISVPWQLVPKEVCAIGRHTVSQCFSFCINSYELGLYAAKVPR